MVMENNVSTQETRGINEPKLILKIFRRTRNLTRNLVKTYETV